MLFDSTALLLRSLVHALEEDPHSEWDEHLECGKQCAFELFQMSRASTHRADSNPKFHTAIPAPERANRAIPYVKSMNAAIRNADRAGAIESGKAAIAEMNGTPAVRHPEPAARPAGNGQPENLVAADSPKKDPAALGTAKQPAARKRRTPRAFTAASN